MSTIEKEKLYQENTLEYWRHEARRLQEENLARDVSKEVRELKEIIKHAKGTLMIGMIILRQINEHQEYSYVLDNLWGVIEMLNGKRPLL